MLTDIAIAYDSNVNRQEIEKLSKYKDLEIEVCRKRKVRTKSVPITVGASGIINKGLDQYLQLLPGNHSAKELQTTTLMNTAHTIRKLLG
jgi:hypothetical protein